MERSAFNIGARAATTNPADWENVKSPETYLGYARAEGFAPPGAIAVGERQAYSPPVDLKRNQWALAGEWTIRSQPAISHEAGGSVTFRFHARDLNLVLAPAESGASIPFRVTLDGEAPGRSRGSDVDERGNGVVTEPRLYGLIRQSGRIEDRTFEITFLEPGAQAYVFTFG
jgi:hypothetical protein